jgi:hypothetical protein
VSQNYAIQKLVSSVLIFSSIQTTMATASTTLTTTSALFATTLFILRLLHLTIFCPFLYIDRAHIGRKPQHMGNFLIISETALEEKLNLTKKYLCVHIFDLFDAAFAMLKVFAFVSGF